MTMAKLTHDCHCDLADVSYDNGGFDFAESASFADIWSEQPFLACDLFLGHTS